MLIAQLSDPHIALPGERPYGRVDTAGSLKRAVAAIAAASPRPDLLVLTGDLVHHGLPEEYTHLKALLSPLDLPILAIPGNHDDRESMRAAFLSEGYLPRAGFLHFVVEFRGLRILGLDTLDPGKDGGILCAERLSWIAAALAAAPDWPCLILMHHPPFPTGIAPMDRIGLEGGEGFAEIVRRHPRIERILCGHVHRGIDCRFAGTIAGTAPSTAHQLQLNLDPAAAGSCFVLEPGGYQLHLWQEATGIVTHTALLGEFPGPYPFKPAL
jgi:3',5'-cyclic AMP phosphodiesterase CpdA